MTRNRWYDEPVIRPTLFVVPSGETVSVALTGYTRRFRGDREGTKVAQYRCPVHGLFDARVSRADEPDEVACPAMIGRMTSLHELDAEMWDQVRDLNVCRASSPWAGSLCGIGFAAGEVTS